MKCRVGKNHDAKMKSESRTLECRVGKNYGAEIKSEGRTLECRILGSSEAYRTIF